MSKSKSNVVHIDDYFTSWQQVFRTDDPVNGTCMTVHVNRRTGCVDVVMCNDEGESITTHMTGVIGTRFVEALKSMKLETYHGEEETKKQEAS